MYKKPIVALTIKDINGKLMKKKHKKKTFSIIEYNIIYIYYIITIYVNSLNSTHLYMLYIFVG